MTQTQIDFIETVGKIARENYLHRDKWILPSVCIAQAILESGWNINATSLFGIKGDGVLAETMEYVNGEYINIIDEFRTYPDLTSSIVGYYDFITTTERYENCVNNSDYENCVYSLIHTKDGYPYATAPNYIETIVSIINDFELTRFDSRFEEPKNDDNIINELIEIRNSIDVLLNKLKREV